MKAILAICLLSLAYGHHLTAFSASNFTESVYNFTTGLVSGIKNQDADTACYNNTAILLDSVVNIATDINTLIHGDFNGVIKLILDTKPAYNSLLRETTVCNFTAFVDDVTPFFGPNGYKLMMEKYFMNLIPLTEDLTALSSGDPYKIGFAVGDATRRVSTWSL
jgi:hypothetical protein